MAKEEILQPLLDEEEPTGTPLRTASQNKADGGNVKSGKIKTELTSAQGKANSHAASTRVTVIQQPRVPRHPHYALVSGEVADLVGGCSCSWGFTSWSTPPGGDRQKSRRRRALCISAAIVGVIFSILATICHFSGPFDIVRISSSATFHTLKLSIGRSILMHVHSHDINEDLENNTTSPVLLEIIMGREIPQHVPYLVKYSADGSLLSVEFEHFAKLSVQHSFRDNDNPRFQCYNISWTNDGAPGCTFEDALVLGDAHWYGGAPVHEQKWPLETWDKPSQAFITGDSNKGYYGGIQARYWLSSNGVALHVDWAVPLFLGVNHKQDGLMRLTSKCASPYTRQWRSKPAFDYTFCHDHDGNMKHAHQFMSRKFLPLPKGIPDKRLFNESLWSTWARYKKKLDQDTVLEFGNEIYQNGFSPAQFEIDDDWTPHYGDFEFDSKKFSDPKLMVEELKALGFRVSLWTHPFASPLSYSFYTGMAEQYWVQNWLLDVPAIVVWGDGLGALLDVTNPKAVEWHMDKLTQLQTQYGIHSFKFDDGEGAWLPTWHRTHQNIHNPNEYTKLYAQMAYKADPQSRSQEVRAGIGTQDLPLFTRIKDKFSNWGYDNGLKTLIPHVLTFGIIGYPFVLPDMIGGNAYGQMSSSSFPERELYIRWLQACTFFPSMQFSIPPWYYDEEVTSIAQKMYALHQRFAPTIIKLAEDATKTGAPIVRPLWWVCPRETECHTIDNQYLVGNDLLVAPVLDQGALKRDIYLPYGLWEDQVHGGISQGPVWLKDYPADLKQLPFFIRKHHH